jgi:hypothetical protein
MPPPAPAPPPSRSFLPGLTLVFLAPMLAEVLPGATRLSAIFVLPIEMCVWGGGALLIRAAARRFRLGWRNVVLLALALALAEELLIQQTSLAPLVIKLHGVEYARAFGVNYVYLLWALAYEAVFVALLPIALAELIFPSRRHAVWLDRAGLGVACALFALGCGLAWFTWTQVARPRVFHVPAYTPPPAALVLGLVAIFGLLFAALGRPRRALARPSAPLRPPAPVLIGAFAGAAAIAWFGLLLVAFGIAPDLPPAAAIVPALALLTALVTTFPRWAAHAGWRDTHIHAAVFGGMLGSMAAFFVAFLGGADPMDLYFKIAVDVAATAAMIALASKVRARHRRTVGSGMASTS